MKVKEDIEPLYNNQQIFIPPNFPHLLKKYAKAAIRTQPYDLLTWSASYFRALADGKIPPVKARLEYPVIKSAGGLTPGYLKLIIQQHSEVIDVNNESLVKTWNGICLNENELKQILCLAGVYKTENFPFNKFVAVAAGFLMKNLTQTMIMLCELYTEEPDGGSAAISSDLFIDLYTFLASIDASKQNKFIDGLLEDGNKTVQSQEIPEVVNTNAVEIEEENKISEVDKVTDENVFDDLKDFMEKKMESSQSEEIAESSDTQIVTSTETDEVYETESTQSSSVNKMVKKPLKFHEITESFDDPHKYSQDEFEAYSSTGESSASGNRNVILRVFSEDGEKIGSLSSMSIQEDELPTSFRVLDEKKDVSVEERQAIMEQLENNKNEKIKNMEALMNSVEDLAEKSQITTVNKVNDKQKNSEEVHKQSSVDSNMSIKPEVHPDAKGVVNPIFKGLFDNVVDKMCVVNAFQEAVEHHIPEVIVVPPIPGIGGIVIEEISDEFLKYVRETAADQCDMFMPRDIRHYFCPPLEKS